MAQYRHLPLYKVAYKLLQAVEEATIRFPRIWKFSYGDSLRREVVEMVVLVFNANSHSGEERIGYISKFLEKLVATEALMRNAKEMHLLTIKQFSEIVGLTDSLGKQASGWQKATEKLLGEKLLAESE